MSAPLGASPDRHGAAAVDRDRGAVHDPVMVPRSLARGCAANLFGTSGARPTMIDARLPQARCFPPLSDGDIAVHDTQGYFTKIVGDRSRSHLKGAGSERYEIVS